MTDNKYNAVFGDMAQFIGMMPDCEFVDGTYGYKRKGDKFYYCERHNEKYGWSVSQKVSIDFRPIAMRELVSPKPTWTKADRKAWKLPEVGSEIAGDVTGINNVLFSSDEFIVTLSQGGAIGKYSKEEVFDYFNPIESPEEKAARLREEWKNNVIEIHHGKRRKMSTSTFLLDDIYDALLSGELPVPVKGE